MIFQVYAEQGEDLREDSIFWSLMFVVIGVINAISTTASVRIFFTQDDYSVLSQGYAGIFFWGGGGGFERT